MLKKIGNFRKYFPFIPDKYKDEFVHTVIKENYTKLVIFSIFAIITISTIYLMLKGIVFGIEILGLSIVILNLIFLPVFIFIKKGTKKSSFPAHQIIQIAYTTAMIALGCAVSLVSQPRFGTINIYILITCSLSVFILITPVVYSLILLTVYAGFFLSLPLYQKEDDAVMMLRIIALVMNMFIWLFSRVAVKLRMQSFIDRKALEEKNIRLSDIAVRDSMTDLINHNHSIKMLKDEIMLSPGNGMPLSVIMLDIDFFKQVNDSFGHGKGDEVIIVFSGMLLNTCRHSDIVGRYGGEEFIIILPHTPLKDAATIAERIRASAESHDFGIGVRITVSGGVCERSRESAEELIKKADEKLYKAKAGGRNRIVV